MAHDQFFKELFQAFFQQFLELFFPDAAARLDFGSVEFLDKEMFTDTPSGAVREADLVARVRTREGEPELILVHIEVQSRREGGFGARMAEYYMLLRLRHRVPVFPIVFHLERGAGGLRRDDYEEHVLGQRVLRFSYNRVGVRDLPAAPYLEDENPLAPALAALMQPGQERPSQVKARALLRVARSLVDEARKRMLSNCVEAYLPLSPSEQQAFESLTRQPELQEVTQMQSIYEIRGEARGVRKAALVLLRQKFGALPPQAEERVQAMESEDEITALLAGILGAQSLADLGLEGDAGAAPDERSS